MCSDSNVSAAGQSSPPGRMFMRLVKVAIGFVVLIIVTCLGLVLWTHYLLRTEVAQIRDAKEPLTWNEFISDVATSGAGADYAAGIAELNRIYADYESAWQWEQTEAHIAAEEALHQRTEQLRESLRSTHDAAELEAEIAAEVDRLRPLPMQALSDPFTGQPMRIRLRDTGVTIYSVGEDLRDDGGRLDQAEGRRAVDDGVRLGAP